MSDPRDSKSPFGVLDFLAWDGEKYGAHYKPGDAEKSAALMAEAGVGFVRFDFLWEDIEPQPGQFNFSKYDRLVDLLLRQGVRIEALLAYNPSWSNSPWNQAPDIVAYCRYARAVVDHFKDRVRHWELWHEPDSPDFWQPQDAMQSYVQLLKHCYPLLKTVDPTCVIHLGGMSRSLPMSLKNIYEKGGKAYFDVVNIHPFANPLTPGALEAMGHMHKFVYRVMENYGDGEKPIWFTEVGCPGMENPKTSKNWWLGANPDLETQAQWITTVYNEALGWRNVQKVFWCFFRDTQDHFKCGSDFDGLVTHDFKKKPSFDTYRKITTSYTALSRR